jgi:WD40 repeat protein
VIISDLPVGGELLGYRVGALLGRGGMGVVFLAEDLRLGRSVALKLLAPSLAEDGGFRERFLAESRLAASLDHPCVVPIYEAGESAGRLFIAMRFVEGGDLRRRLRGGSLTAERAVRVCAQVADALDFAHARGLVHRDVKPSNVLLDGRDNVYLADFGLTRGLQEPQPPEPGLLGTIAYVAPEQIRGEKVDGRADEYSLACLLYECLVGAAPFARSTEAAVLFAHLEEEPPAPPGLERVMRTGLAKEPECRYATCAELVLAAAEALGLLDGTRSAVRKPSVLSGGAVCPFKGLAFFDRSDAEYFFGRERVVGEVVAQLAGSTVVGILGPSGVGKSSVLRAGVLPALSAGALPGSAGWRQVLVRPGAHPLAELRRALGGEELRDAVGEVAVGERIVVAIDQLEELFTSCEGEEERVAFLDELAAAARDQARRALVLASLRADFYGRLAAYQGFARLLSRSHVLVGPMDSDDLERAVAEPASRAGLEVERPLVDALVTAVSGEAGGLPLLSTMLLELWQAREGPVLRFDRYRASGGVRGAVARLAERAFAELGDEDRRIARGVMLRLVSGRETQFARRRVPLSEIQQIEGAEGVLTTLTDARLLTVDGGEVEVAHEALFREWPRLRRWLEEDLVGLRLHAHMADTAREWDASDRDPSDLYRGLRLAAALDWAGGHAGDVNTLEREFLDASRIAAEREDRRRRVQNRRLRRLAVGVSVLFVLGLVAAGVAEIQQRKADRARRTAQAIQLAANAQAALPTDPQVSTLLALQSLRVSETGQGARALREALPQLRELGTLDAGMFDPSARITAAFSPDSREIVTTDSGLYAQIWSTASHRQIAVITSPEPIVGAAFSPDGRSIVTIGSDGIPQVWSTATQTLVASFVAPPWQRTLVGQYLPAGSWFSPDGREIVAGGPDGSVRVWSVSSHRELGQLATPGVIADAAFSPDSTEVVTTGADGEARIFGTRSLRQLGVLASPSWLADAEFSPDGKEIVTGGADGAARIWSVRSHRQLSALGSPDETGISALFSPDGREVVTGSGDGTVRVWSVSDGRQLFVLPGQTGGLAPEFSPDGRVIVTANAEGTAALWRAEPVEQLKAFTEPGNEPLAGAAFAGDATRIVTISARGTARLWSAGTLRELRVLSAAAPARSRVVAVSPDGKEIVTMSAGGTARVWSDRTHKQLAVLPLGIPGWRGGVAFSDDGDAVAVVSGFQTARIWRARTQRQLTLSEADQGSNLQDVVFSPDGTKVLGVTGTAAYIWSADSGLLLTTIPLTTSPAITNAIWSPDGNAILTFGTQDSTARIWSTATHREIGAITEPDGTLNGVAFSPDGKQIVTASNDGTARIWNASTGVQLTAFTEPGNASVITAVFSPNGKQIVTASSDGATRIWSTELAGPIDTLKRIAETRVGRQLTTSERRAYLAGP